MRFECRTLFDITPTGVTGHFKASRLPFRDKCRQIIEDEWTWNRARNQQRNWETITQIIGLRAQIDDISEPTNDFGEWVFEFSTATPGAFGHEQDPTLLLKYDAAGVPMINDLNNEVELPPSLIISGENQNIWFEVKK